MGEFRLRAADVGDAAAIRSLIQRAQINPFGLNWRRFVIAVNSDGEMIGCAQIKPHPGGVRELASLAVEPAYRLRGVARMLISHFMEEAPRPLYLMCMLELGGFYKKFGFQRMNLDDMPAYFRRIKRMAEVYERVNGGREVLLVMKLM